MTGETFGGVLAAALARGGDRVALRAHGDVRTYRQLHDNAARFANALAGLGVRPGERVALMAQDRAEPVEAYLGCFLAGVVPVHVNDRLAGPEIDAVLADADVRVFGYSGALAEKVASSSAVAAADLVLTLGDGERSVGAHRGWTDLLGPASSAVPEVPRAPKDHAIIGYTSGTTGRPKGVVHTQLTMLRALRHMPVHFDIRPRSRCAFTGTLSFVSGLWGVLLPHLYLGGEISFVAGLTPDAWIDHMIESGSNFTYVPTPLATAFADQVRRRPEVLRTLHSAVHSGSQLPPTVMRDVVDAIGGRFGESYGMTETGAPVTRTEDADWIDGCAADDVWASTGRPIHITEVSVLDRDGIALPHGETGEIAVRSETMFAGYFRRPDLTEQALVDGWLRTGDIGRLDGAGYLYVTDRAKDMIVSGGMNVFPAEVEAALVDVPGLAELAVIGVPDERWGETVVAVAVRAPAADGDRLDEAALIGAARNRIASYKKPTRVEFVDSLPRTASLKIDKPELRRRWAAGDLSRPAPAHDGAAGGG